MTGFSLATIQDASGLTAAIVSESEAWVVAERPSVLELLQDWPTSLERLEADVRTGSLASAQPVAEVEFLAPVPNPPNLFMAGANYADHAREMRGLAAGAPVEKPQGGPFIFLKPTTTLVGHRHPIKLSAGANQVDWEVELAAVIGRRAHRVSAERALEYVAGYTVVNDVSVRGGWVREGAEPPMTFDWFMQKGWQTSCPCGPWLMPAQLCPDPGDLALRLSVNGRVEQNSRTSEMIFPLEELIAYISRVLPLVPGDIIATGTCAGVGAGKERYLEPGDVVVAEIEGIGALENPVVAD